MAIVLLHDEEIERARRYVTKTVRDLTENLRDELSQSHIREIVASPFGLRATGFAEIAHWIVFSYVVPILVNMPRADAESLGHQLNRYIQDQQNDTTRIFPFRILRDTAGLYADPFVRQVVVLYPEEQDRWDRMNRLWARMRVRRPLYRPQGGGMVVYSHIQRDFELATGGMGSPRFIKWFSLAIAACHAANATLIIHGMGPIDPPFIKLRATPVTLHHYPMLSVYGDNYLEFGKLFMKGGSKTLKHYYGQTISDWLVFQIGGFIHGYRRDRVRNSAGITHSNKWLLRHIRLSLNYASFKMPGLLPRILMRSTRWSTEYVSPVELPGPPVDVNGAPTEDYTLHHIYGRRTADALRSALGDHLADLKNLRFKERILEESMKPFLRMRRLVNALLTRIGHLYRAQDEILRYIERGTLLTRDPAESRRVLEQALTHFNDQVLNRDYKFQLAAYFWRIYFGRAPLAVRIGQDHELLPEGDQTDLRNYFMHNDRIEIINGYSVFTNFIDKVNEDPSLNIRIRDPDFPSNLLNALEEICVPYIKAIFDIHAAINDAMVPRSRDVHAEVVGRIRKGFNKLVHGMTPMNYQPTEIREKFIKKDLKTDVQLNAYDIKNFLTSLMNQTSIANRRVNVAGVDVDTRFLYQDVAEAINQNYTPGSMDNIKLNSKLGRWLDTLILADVPEVSQLVAKIINGDRNNDVLFDNEIFHDAYIALCLLDGRELDEFINEQVIAAGPLAVGTLMRFLQRNVLGTCYRVRENTLRRARDFDMQITRTKMTYAEFGKRRLVLKWFVDKAFKSYYGLGTGYDMTPQSHADHKRAIEQAATPGRDFVDMFHEDAVGFPQIYGYPASSAQIEDFLIPLPLWYTREACRRPAQFVMVATRVLVASRAQAHIFMQLKDSALQHFFSTIATEVPALSGLLDAPPITATQYKTTLFLPTAELRLVRALEAAAGSLTELKLLRPRATGKRFEPGGNYNEAVDWLLKWVATAVRLGIGGHTAAAFVRAAIDRAKELMRGGLRAEFVDDRRLKGVMQAAHRRAHLSGMQVILREIIDVFHRVNPLHIDAYVPLSRLLFGETFEKDVRPPSGPVSHHVIVEAFASFNGVSTPGLPLVRANIASQIYSHSHYETNRNRNVIAALSYFITQSRLDPAYTDPTTPDVYIDLMRDIFGAFINPVPQRYRHIYTLTPRSIGILTGSNASHNSDTIADIMNRSPITRWRLRRFLSAYIERGGADPRYVKLYENLKNE